MRIPGLKTRDEKLADRIANGDTVAMEALYNDYYDAIYNYIYYRLGNNHHAAEDIIQNVFFTMITEIKNFKPEKGGLYAWLCGIARHQVIRHLRLGQSRPTTAISETSEDGEFGWIELLDRSPLPDAALENEEVKACIAGVLARLPGKYSLVLRQKYMDDLSVDAIAEKYIGKRVKLSGYLKTENVKKWAGFWLRVDGKDPSNMSDKSGFAFASMQNHGALSGNTDWTEAKLVLDVPLEAKQIVFGVILDGVGKVWINNVKFEVVSKDEPLTEYPDVKTEPVNLDFTK